jgi:hypothetical protein
MAFEDSDRAGLERKFLELLNGPCEGRERGPVAVIFAWPGGACRPPGR